MRSPPTSRCSFTRSPRNSTKTISPSAEFGPCAARSVRSTSTAAARTATSASSPTSRESPGATTLELTSCSSVDDEPVAVPLGDAAADDVVVAHEAGDELGLGPRRDRQRVGDLLDPRVVHDDDPVGHRERFLLVVRDVDEHQAELALEVAQLDAHPQLEQPVEVAERLVEEERLRLRHEHARERDPLLLAAGERARLAVGELRQADHLERVQRLLAALVLRRRRAS